MANLVPNDGWFGPPKALPSPRPRCAGPPRAAHFGLRAEVKWTEAGTPRLSSGEGRVSDESAKSLPAPAGCCRDRFSVVAEPAIEPCRAEARVSAGGPGGGHGRTAGGLSFGNRSSPVAMSHKRNPGS
jgi:hypothetical protein